MIWTLGMSLTVAPFWRHKVPTGASPSSDIGAVLRPECAHCVDDEIVTLKNDRKLRSAPGEFVRNGERWRVVEQRCDPGLEVFWRSRRLTPVELLANVMRRDGAERSAHDVARENLARMEDVGLLGRLLTEARRDLDGRSRTASAT